MDIIRDLQEAVKSIEETGPFFTCVADLPCLSANHIIRNTGCIRIFGKRGPFNLGTCPMPGSEGVEMPYTECICGVDACPAGINILRGDHMDRPQDEEKFLMLDRHLAYNINTRAIWNGYAGFFHVHQNRRKISW